MGIAVDSGITYLIFTTRCVDSTYNTENMVGRLTLTDTDGYFNILAPNDFDGLIPMTLFSSHHDSF